MNDKAYIGLPIMKEFNNKDLLCMWKNAQIESLLISYPQSGNTWLRYCIEYLSKRPTVGATVINYVFNRPIGTIVDIGIDMSGLPILNKEHSLKNFNDVVYDGRNIDEDTKLLVIVRNYKECILRHRCYSNIEEEELEEDWNEKFLSQISGEVTEIGSRDYADILLDYDKYSGSKKIVYYEDLILDAENVLREILEFLDINDGYLSEFIRDLDVHKQTSSQIYRWYSKPCSLHKCNSLTYHSDKLPIEQRKRIDVIFEERHPLIFEKYLKRYRE